MDIEERIKNLAQLIATTTNPRVREELEKELQRLLEQKHKPQQPRDERGRFKSKELTQLTQPIKQPLEPGKIVVVQKFRVPDHVVVQAYEDEGRRFGTTKFLQYTMPRIFLEHFKNNPLLRDFVNRKCYLQLKITVQFYREQPVVGETFQLNRTIPTFYDPNFRRREYLIQSINDLKVVIK
jgi:hypothetical protein